MKKILMSCAILIAILLTGCEQKQKLHIYTWSDYIAPDLIQEFEQENNCKVVIDTFDSNETMYAKLKAGGTGYDIIMPSSYFVPLLSLENIIEQIDRSKIENVITNFDYRYANLIASSNFTYSVPYAISYTGFMYKKDKISESEVNSWSVLTNKSLYGKITLLDDIREIIGAGLIANGYSASSTNSTEIVSSVKTVLDWRKFIRKFDAESYKTEVASGSTYLGMGYSMDAYQVIVGVEGDGSDSRDDIGFVLPKEGYTVSCDEISIAKLSEKKDLAYKFINFMYKTENAKINMEYIVGLVPHKKAIESLDEEYKKLIIISDEMISKGHVIVPVDYKTMEYYNNAWDEIKSTRNNYEK